MKYIGILTILMASQAFSATPVVDPRNLNCSELQSMLEQNGELIVLRKVFGIPLKRRVAPVISCKRLYYPMPAYFKTIDNQECEVGEYCQADHSTQGGDGHVGGQ